MECGLQQSKSYIKLLIGHFSPKGRETCLTLEFLPQIKDDLEYVTGEIGLKKLANK